MLPDIPHDGHGTGGQQRGVMWQWQSKERVLQINWHTEREVKLATQTGTERLPQTLSPRLRLAKIFELRRR